MAGPQLGEQRSANGETREWTGSEWKPVNAPPAPVSSSETSDPTTASIQALKDYASELMSGKGTARSQVADYGGKELKAFGSQVNPINTIAGVGHLLTTDPRESIPAIGKGLRDTASGVLSGDPSAIGSALGMVAAPRVLGGTLSATNAAAGAVADNPMLAKMGGAITGGLTARAAGVPWYVGAMMGRAARPLITGAASKLADASGSLMETLGMREPPTGIPAAATDLSQSVQAGAIGPAGIEARIAAVKAQGGLPNSAAQPKPVVGQQLAAQRAAAELPPLETGAKVNGNPAQSLASSLGTPSDVSMAQQVASRNVTGDWNTNAKPAFSAQDMLKMQVMKQQNPGIAEADLVKAVLAGR